MKLCLTCLRCYEDETPSCSDETHDALITPRYGSCVIDRKYRLTKVLDRGGMGTVYEATHLELDGPRAIKILVPEYVSADPQARGRLRQEALTACTFDHPNLVRLYDYGTNIVSVEDKGRVHEYDELYIVMELLRGQSLKEILAVNKRLEVRHAIAIAIQIAEGLAELHSKGIVYRDLKPANVLIGSDYKGELQVKIVDFGAVKLRNNALNGEEIDLTEAMFVGSPLYASPENCKGEPLDDRSDIYGLGLILYEMLAGVRPFAGNDFLTLLNGHAYATPPPLTNVPEGVADLTRRALRKCPSERPQTAKEFADSLRALDSGTSSVPLTTRSGNLLGTEDPGVRSRGRYLVKHSFVDLASVVTKSENAKSEETVVQDRRKQSEPLALDEKQAVVEIHQRPQFTSVSVPATRSSRAFNPIRKIVAVVVVSACLAQAGSLSVGPRRSANNPRLTRVASVTESLTPPLVGREENKPQPPKPTPTIDQRPLIAGAYLKLEPAFPKLNKTLEPAKPPLKPGLSKANGKSKGGATATSKPRDYDKKWIKTVNNGGSIRRPNGGRRIEMSSRRNRNRNGDRNGDRDRYRGRRAQTSRLQIHKQKNSIRLRHRV